MRSGSNSARKLKLIELSSLFQINIKFFHLLAQDIFQLVVDNNFADKQVTLFKEDQEQYSLLIHK